VITDKNPEKSNYSALCLPDKHFNDWVIAGGENGTILTWSLAKSYYSLQQELLQRVSSKPTFMAQNIQQIYVGTSDHVRHFSSFASNCWYSISVSRRRNVSTSTRSGPCNNHLWCPSSSISIAWTRLNRRRLRLSTSRKRISRRWLSRRNLIQPRYPFPHKQGSDSSMLSIVMCYSPRRTGSLASICGTRRDPFSATSRLQSMQSRRCLGTNPF
jgi:hypothetical protein